MLEKLVADLLTKVVGGYIEGLQGDSLSIGIWGGRSRLTDLKVKRSVIDDLDIPFALAEGVLGSLEVTIPWRTLFTDSTIVRLSDLYILLRPRSLEPTYDATKQRDAEQKRKRKRLNELEAIKQEKRQAMVSQSHQDEEIVGGDQSEPLQTRLLTLLLENVQIFIDNVHIRIEDPAHQWAAGLTLRGVAACTDSLKETLDHFIHKFLTVNELGVYWNDYLIHPVATGGTLEQFKTQMQRYIGQRNLLDDTHYMVRPLNFSADLQLKRGLAKRFDVPGQLVHVLIEQLQIQLNDAQLRQILRLKDRIELYRTRKQYRMYRPLQCTPTTDPLRWWKFLFDANVTPVKRQRRLFSASWLTQRRRDRLDYIKLWQGKLLNTLTPAQAHQLDTLEDKLEFEDLSIFRSMAEANVPFDKLPGAQPAQQASWWSWGSSFFSPQVAADSTQLSTEILKEQAKLSDREREALYTAIGYTDVKLHAHADVPVEVGRLFL